MLKYKQAFCYIEGTMERKRLVRRERETENELERERKVLMEADR